MTINRDVGFAFPFRFDQGGTATVGGLRREQTNEDRDAAVRAGAEQILLTDRGERVMLGGLGAGLQRWLFQPVPGTEPFITQDAITAVETWCKRARVTSAQHSVDVLKGSVEVLLSIRHSDGDAETAVRVAVNS